MPEKNKVVLFPKWRKSLENEGLLALKENRFDDALNKLNELLEYEVNSHEIMMGKLICLMELERFDDAQDFCETLLANKSKYYFEYVHIYLSILFQTEQYALLVEQVEHELKKDSLPFAIKEQFQLLHKMSKEMLEEITGKKAVELFAELKVAIKEQNYARQWQIIESLHKMRIKPSTEALSCLVNKEVHPVVQTAIFEWIQNEKIEQRVDINKMDVEISVIPTEISPIRDHPLMKDVLLLISDLEQKNPSLFILLNQILYRYFYVWYPIFPSEDDALLISKALKEVGKELLHMKMNEETNAHVMEYVEELRMCEALYLSVIEE